MITELDAVEARILGCLIEKSFLTPDQYPLSFNALMNACNQKTSREPVMELDIDTLGNSLNILRAKGLADQKLGSRVPKFTHLASVLGAGDSTETLAVLCVLLLRGPQTAAEIRARSERIAKFTDNLQVEVVLEKLEKHPDGPFVARLPRGRYQHLFCGAAPVAAAPIIAPAPDRLAKLEERVTALESLCKELQEKTAKPAGVWPAS